MKILVLTLGILMSNFAVAELKVVVINTSSLPYDLKPSYYLNKPSYYLNKESYYLNKSSYYLNKSSYYQNKRSHYQNKETGSNRLLSEDGVYVGYFVKRDDGHVNYFYASGSRFGFTPTGGHTDSIFSDGSWCGTIGQIDGVSVVGLERSCYEQLTKEVREEQEASREFCLDMYERYRARLDEDPKLAEAFVPMLISMDCGYLLSED